MGLRKADRVERTLGPGGRKGWTRRLGLGGVRTGRAAGTPAAGRLGTRGRRKNENPDPPSRARRAGVERSADAGSAGSLRGRRADRGRCGEAAAGCQERGSAHSPLCSPRNTSLNFLSGFPKSPPADMMEPEELLPPQPRDRPDRRCSNRLPIRASGKASAELSRPLQGPAEQRGWRTAALATDKQQQPPPPRRVA